MVTIVHLEFFFFVDYYMLMTLQRCSLMIIQAKEIGAILVAFCISVVFFIVVRSCCDSHSSLLTTKWDVNNVIYCLGTWMVTSLVLVGIPIHCLLQPFPFRTEELRAVRCFETTHLLPPHGSYRVKRWLDYGCKQCVWVGNLALLNEVHSSQATEVTRHQSP